ncbi:MAG TPA: hypothetical protein VF262_08390, partial [Burkholderiales bacterium]
MANTAPYLAAPMQRLSAGAVDFVLCMAASLFGFGVLVSASDAQSTLDLVVRNPALFLVYA